MTIRNYAVFTCVFIIFVSIESPRASRLSVGFKTPCPETVGEWGSWRKKALEMFPQLILGDLEFIERCKKEVPEPFRDLNVNVCIGSINQALKASGSGVSKEVFTEIEIQNPSITKLPEIDFAALNKSLQTNPSEEIDKILKSFPNARILLRETKVDQPIFGPHNTNKNYIILIPGKVVDQYINASRSGILVLAVAKSNKHAMNFWASLPSLTKFELQSGPGVTTGCVKCHQSGAIAVLEQSDTFGTLTSLNPKLSTATVRDALNEEVIRTADAVALGMANSDLPPFGVPGPENRSIDFLRRCAGSENYPLPMKSLLVIKSAMECAGCHNG